MTYALHVRSAKGQAFHTLVCGFLLGQNTREDLVAFLKERKHEKDWSFFMDRGLGAGHTHLHDIFHLPFNDAPSAKQTIRSQVDDPALLAARSIALFQVCKFRIWPHLSAEEKQDLLIDPTLKGVTLLIDAVRTGVPELFEGMLVLYLEAFHGHTISRSDLRHVLLDGTRQGANLFTAAAASHTESIVGRTSLLYAWAEQQGILSKEEHARAVLNDRVPMEETFADLARLYHHPQFLREFCALALTHAPERYTQALKVPAYMHKWPPLYWTMHSNTAMTLEIGKHMQRLLTPKDVHTVLAFADPETRMNILHLHAQEHGSRAITQEIKRLAIFACDGSESRGEAFFQKLIHERAANGMTPAQMKKHPLPNPSHLTRTTPRNGTQMRG